MFPIVPRAAKIEPYVTLDQVFSSEELDRLEAAVSGATDTGETGNDAPIRRSKVRWMNFEPTNTWLYERVADVASAVNAQHFRFDITGLGEMMQLARYEDSEQGHYGWHQDYGAGVSRKLSMTVQLTDPDCYDGGDLEIMAESYMLLPGRERGRVVVFPAYQVHRITPVERGARHSLVAWISGPAFR